MSDPRHSDPRRNDPLRRFDLQGSGGAGMIWTWLAAIIATVIVIGLVIGYSRTNQASLHAPATTGSAPSGLTHAPRPVPKSGDLPATPPTAPAPVRRPQDRDL